MWAELAQILKWPAIVVGVVAFILILRKLTQRDAEEKAVEKNERKEAEGAVEIQSDVIEVLSEPVPEHDEWLARERKRLFDDQG